ncbi:portal vertex protein of head [Escherichia phage Bp7]|uniref:Portal vertex protein of head n=1 Tax=Escherichia phage Bp7 TaxID=1052121 RepID=G3MV37_9CAUD|nr:portal vertex protein of head [Escherichia phage Bp7]AEN93953.1 portal vertex protein of head [Escherichia phage Bp7]
MANFNTILSFLKPWANEDEKEFKQQINNNLESVTAPKLDDGAREIETQEQNIPYNALMQQMFGSNEPEVKNTRELIDTYRNLMNNYEVDNAVQEIVSDAIVYEMIKK